MVVHAEGVVVGPLAMAHLPGVAICGRAVAIGRSNARVQRIIRAKIEIGGGASAEAGRGMVWNGPPSLCTWFWSLRCSNASRVQLAQAVDLLPALHLRIIFEVRGRRPAICPKGVLITTSTATRCMLGMRRRPPAKAADA